MSGTSFAIRASVVGLVASWGILGATFAVALESPALFIGLFLGIFAPFFVAVWSHPKREVHGTTISVSWLEVLKTAPPWSTALAVAALAIMVACAWMVPEFASGSSSKFSITRAELTGRPDRARCIAAFCAAFYAITLHFALAARAARTKMALPWVPP